MTFLLDTNVVSEGVKAQPNRAVMEWLASVDEDRTFLSVVTLAEIRNGIEQMRPGKRRGALPAWLEEDLQERFSGRLLEVTAPIAHAWGRAMASSLASGAPLSAMDAFFAATAAVEGLTLVTRNTRHFEKTGIRLLNPWRTS